MLFILANRQSVTTSATTGGWCGPRSAVCTGELAIGVVHTGEWAIGDDVGGGRLVRTALCYTGKTPVCTQHRCAHNTDGNRPSVLRALANGQSVTMSAAGGGWPGDAHTEPADGRRCRAMGIDRPLRTGLQSVTMSGTMSADVDGTHVGSIWVESS